MNLPQSLRALNSPNFRRYFAGQAISMIGTWVQSLAVMWTAYRITGSTTLTGLVGFLSQFPYLVLSPFAGVLGDRIDRRRILITVHSLLLVQASTLAVLSGLHLLQYQHLAMLALAGGVLASFETPTRQSFFVQLLEDRGDLPNAIALNSILMNGTRLVGPSIGGLLIAAFGETTCFTVNAVSYLAVLYSLFGIRHLKQVQARAQSHPLRDLADGFRYAMGFGPIRALLLMLAAVSFSISPYTVLMPAIAVQAYGKGAELVGLFIGAVGLGAVISAISLARRSSIRGLAKWLSIAACVAGLGMIGFSFSRTVWLSALLMSCAGFGMFMQAAASNTILQSIVDDDKRSRVMSYYTMFFIGSAPLGNLTGGWLAERIGAPHTMLAGGAIALAAGLAFAFYLPRLRLELRPVYVKQGIIPKS
jgi:MFS family permease